MSDCEEALAIIQGQDAAARGIIAEVHVAIRTDGKTGSGTILDPYDWSDPDLAEDMLVQWSMEKLPMTINFFHGTFYIPPCVFQNDLVWQVWSNLTIRGQGMGKTILRPSRLGDTSPSVTYRSRVIANFFQSQVSNPPENVVTNFTLEGVTIDCMQETAGAHMWSGIGINGSNIVIRDVEVTRSGGQGITGNSELFPILLGHMRNIANWETQKQLFPGIYVDNVYINKSKMGVSGGATALIVTSWYADTQLSDNWCYYTAMIRNVRASESGIFGVAKINNVLWENCYNDTAGVNIDTGPCRNINFHNCTFLNSPGPYSPATGVNIGSSASGNYFQVGFYNCIFHAIRSGHGFGGVGIRNGVDLTVRDCYFIPTKTENGGDTPDPLWAPIVIKTADGSDNRITISGNRYYNGNPLPEANFFHYGNRTGSYVVQGKAANQIRETIVLDGVPLIDWDMADFNSGNIASRGRSDLQLTTYNGMDVTEDDNGSYLAFNGTDQYALCDTTDLWDRVLDGRPFTIIIDGPNVGGYPVGGLAVRILSTHRNDGWGIGFHLVRANDRRLALGTNTAESLDNLQPTHCYIIPDEPIVRVIVSGNTTSVHIIAIHASGDIRRHVRRERTIATVAHTRRLHVARPVLGTINYGDPSISRIRFFNKFLDTDKL